MPYAAYAIVLLKNGDTSTGPLLPLRGRPKLYVEHIAPDVAARYGEVVEQPEQADLAILRLQTPYEPRDGNFLERLFHAGDLDFALDHIDRALFVVSI